MIRLVGTAGEGEDGTNQESSTETYTLPYVKQMASGNLFYDTGNSNPVSCDSLKGWEGVGGGRKVQEAEDIRVPMADSHRCMAETKVKLQSNYPLIKNK